MSHRVDGLVVLDRDELMPILGSAVVERKRLHGWPLSLVEEIRTEQQRFVLKTQVSCASAERKFYATVSHPMLLNPFAEGCIETCDYLVLPFVDGRCEDWGALDDDAIRYRVREFQRQLAGVCNPPVFFDFSTYEKWIAAWSAIVPVLAAGGLPDGKVNTVAAWLDSRGFDCWNTPVGFLHGDLKGENILWDRDRCFVIDWQRPLLGPLALEESVALHLAGRAGNPENSFDILSLLYMAHWYAWAYTTCLPLPFVRGIAVKYASDSITMMEHL